MKTLQDAFDHVVTSLFKQGEKSMEGDEDPHICAYRGEGGTKCAAGHLIDDAHYSINFENARVNSRAILDAIKNSGWPDNLEAERLYVDLQHIHDHYDFDNWYEAFVHCANAHHLTIKPYDEYEHV